MLGIVLPGALDRAAKRGKGSSCGLCDLCAGLLCVETGAMHALVGAEELKLKPLPRAIRRLRLPLWHEPAEPVASVLHIVLELQVFLLRVSVEATSLPAHIG